MTGEFTCTRVHFWASRIAIDLRFQICGYSNYVTWSSPESSAMRKVESILFFCRRIDGFTKSQLKNRPLRRFHSWNLSGLHTARRSRAGFKESSIIDIQCWSCIGLIVAIHWCVTRFYRHNDKLEENSNILNGRVNIGRPYAWLAGVTVSHGSL